MKDNSNIKTDRVPLERLARVCKDGENLEEPVPLSHFSDTLGWVLLGDPGAGKSDVFKHLARVEGGHYTTARDFLDLGVPTEHRSTIFIDGLDEVSAGDASGSTAVSQIRKKLSELGTPKFRISCREADWRGRADSNALQRLVGEDHFLELHLVPMDEDQITTLIAYWRNTDRAGARDFMREAKSHDLGQLLDNPQSLRMLLEATEDGWPASKGETYDLACKKLLREFNSDHIAAHRNSAISDDRLLDAVGYLSAVFLLSASTAIAWQQDQTPRERAVILSELLTGGDAPDLTTCQLATQTRLFRSDGRGDFVPVHRTVAEYCAARYLATRIHQGLPPNRVLALMLGHDAGVVSELRGLHAWLAVCAQSHLRQDLIERDPLGVVISGDVRAFSRAEKLSVLNALRDEAIRDIHFRRGNWATNPFGALATQNMEADFLELLQSPDRSLPHLALIDCVLDALVHGQSMPSLATALGDVVRDNRFWSGSRKTALFILASFASDHGTWDSLLRILGDVHSGAIEDLEDELLGTLLKALYPNHIAPTAIWHYFRKPKSDSLFGAYWKFWYDFAREKTPDANIPLLLDALADSGYQLANTHDTLRAPQVIGQLIVRGVHLFGQTVDVERLHKWLMLGLSQHFYSPLELEHKQSIAQWISTHPDKYKDLFENSLQRHALSGQSVRVSLLGIRASLYNASEPADANDWLVSLASNIHAEELRRELLRDASQFAQTRFGPSAAIELLDRWMQTHPEDRAWVDSQLQCPYPPPAPQQEYIDQELKYKRHTSDEQLRKLAYFRETLPSFEQGPAHLGALARVADVYLNLFKNSHKETPQERLLELLNGDPEWVRLALHGIRHSVFRADVPAAADIIKLTTEGRRYNLAMPCLAAMALRFTEDPESALSLPSTVLEAVAAFQLTNLFEDVPDWFKLLVERHPDRVSSVIRALVGAQIAAKKEHVDGLNALVYDLTFSRIAQVTLPSLIDDFPHKASKPQLPSCRILIAGMLIHLARPTQLALITSRLSRLGMDVGQHVYWLTAGLLIAPQEYLAQVQSFVGKSQLRASHLYALLSDMRTGRSLTSEQDVPTTTYLVELLGPLAQPHWSGRSNEAYWVTTSMEMGQHVEKLISSLASNPDTCATTALVRLRENTALNQWHDSLDRALADQNITRRKALFQPVSAREACQTLANLSPSNAADLWALTVDHLEILAREIRDGSTNDYRQYWAGTSPKVEDDCRDALLSDLKGKLNPLSIQAEAEGRYADAKRADIKVMAGRFHIPVEIKRESHSDLWKAIPEQLIARYGREAASDGYGIYLVFWFSKGIKAGPVDGGRKPKSPQELRTRLEATVPHTLRHKIAVIVVDCSKPP